MVVKMKNGIKFLQRSAFLLLLSGVLWTTSCGGPKAEDGEGAISFTKEGTIRADIRESFEQSYYDKDELQQTILQEVAEYNSGAGAGSIAVEKVEVEDGTALVQMTYQTSADYAAFNQVTFFCGLAAQAKSEGLNLNVVLSGLKDPTQTVGESDILAMEGAILLITDVQEEISLNGKALYASDNAVISENGKNVRSAGEDGKLIYIIYK